MRLRSESDQALSFNILDVDLEKESEFESISIGGGAKVSRSDVRVGLNGKGASAKVFGASKLGEGQHNDNFVWVDHAVEDCQSEQSFKSIVSRKSKNIMNGTIWVRPGANQTSASQKSQNLLLSSEGEVVIKPRLEIHADDVKCSHGATTGQINKDALFYLRSRGFSESEANMILARAFIYEVLDKIENESAKEVIENNLSEKLDATFRRQIVR
jgi:Fe-S cluster assembly protein SufD